MSIELFLKKIDCSNDSSTALENYIMFPSEEIPELIKKLEKGETITITRSNSDTNKYLKNQIYVSDIGFFLKVTDVQEVDNSDIPTDEYKKNKNSNLNQLVNNYNDMKIITLEPYTKIAQDDVYKSILINDELDKARNIWISSDYHLMIYDDKKGGVSDNKYSDDTTTIQNNCVGDDDIFIYLGDLVDGEVSDQESIKNIIKRLKGKKILIRGNNDVLPDEFYEECGFMVVFDSFKYKNIIFSHPPLHKSQFNGAEYNIHGHIHGYRSYLVPYHNHIDAYFKLHKKVPMTIDRLIENCKDGYYKPKK
jgi:calcineurin-like phosphoesterase family protein